MATQTDPGRADLATTQKSGSRRSARSTPRASGTRSERSAGASGTRSNRSAAAGATASRDTTSTQGRSPIETAQVLAERAVLVPVAAGLVARDNLVSTVKGFATRYRIPASVERELQRYERRGASARNRFERQVRRTRTTLQRELRQRRPRVEKLVSERRGA